MSVFSPMPLPNVESQKQNLLAQLMQQHQQAAMRFAGHQSGFGFNDPSRAIAPPIQRPQFVPGPGPVQRQTAYPPALFGPTIARLRSAGG